MTSALVIAVSSGCTQTSPSRTSLVHDVTNASVGGGIDSGRLETEPHTEHAVVRVLDHARYAIFLAMYILTDRPIIHALERASAQGVTVRVLLEHHPFGMGVQPEHIAQQLRAAGIFVRWTPTRFALAHAKYMVIDDASVAISTANFSRSGFHNDRDFIFFSRDTGCVHDVSNLFRADWNGVPVVSSDANLLIAPDNARVKLENLIGRARSSIRLYGEELQDKRIEVLLAHAMARGVKVRVMLPPGASAVAVRRLRRGRVSVREPAFPYIHAKYVGIDGALSYLGSENFSTASLDRNRELGVTLAGNLGRQLSHRFDVDWSRAGRGP